MIEKLPENTPIMSMEEAFGELFNKIQELIDKVNALEKAVKQCDRPVELEI